MTGFVDDLPPIDSDDPAAHRHATALALGRSVWTSPTGLWTAAAERRDDLGLALD